MFVAYIGNKHGYTLYPPYVEEETDFFKGDDGELPVAEIPDEFAKDLIEQFPRSFREVQTPIPDVLNKKYLESLTGKKGLDLMEKIGIDRFGVDLNKSEGKTKMIAGLLDLQKKAE